MYVATYQNVNKRLIRKQVAYISFRKGGSTGNESFHTTPQASLSGFTLGISCKRVHTTVCSSFFSKYSQKPNIFTRAYYIPTHTTVSQVKTPAYPQTDQYICMCAYVRTHRCTNLLINVLMCANTYVCTHTGMYIFCVL